MKIRFFLLILGFFACAQKMLPPSPDRFSPKLDEVEVLNRTKINLRFNEDIESNTFIKDSILITSVNNETLSIKAIASGRNGSIVTLITAKQSPIRYSIVTKISDVSGNWAKVRGHFTGSIIKDTFPPRITSISPKTGTVKLKKNVRIGISFSEEIDTLKAMNWIVLPKNLKERFKTSWQPDYKQIIFTLSDSLGTDTVVYFVLMCSAFDFEGNRLLSPGLTFFTSDTLMNTKLVIGKITQNNKPVANSFVIFNTTNDSTRSMALIPVDSVGSFAIQIREGIYNVSAVSDTNFDDQIDLSGKILGFNTAKETLYIEVYPESLVHNLDWYLR